MSHISIIQGHPDSRRSHLFRALAEAYSEGAQAGGHRVDVIDVGQLDFPCLRSPEDWHRGRDGTPDALRVAQDAISNADRLFIIYPLWMGTLPAVLKAFLEQVFRPGVALSYGEGYPEPLFRGKSARVVVTMGMPALACRWYFFAHGLKNLQRNILGFAGIYPVRTTLYGLVDKASEDKRHRWMEGMRSLGKKAR